jgi:hypothetical protein
MLRLFGFGVYGIQPYGSVPSLDEIVMELMEVSQ